MNYSRSAWLLGIVLMVTSVAGAQPFQCTANAGVPPIVRAEGIAELVGDVVINCTGGTPTALGADVPGLNLRIFLNVNITSRLLDPDNGNWNEALLIIDDPQPENQSACPNNNCTLVGVGGDCDSRGVGR